MIKKIKTLKLDNKLYILILSLIMIVLNILIFRNCIFRNFTFLSDSLLSDLCRANLPTYKMLFSSLFEGKFSFWKYEMGIGTDIFSHGDVLFDPFTYLIFIGGKNNLQFAFCWVVIIKSILQACFFFIYLNHFKINKWASLIASISYGMCGYTIITGSNFALGTSMVYLPLIVLGVEKIIEKKNNFYLCLISLFLLCIYNYYYFYLIGIFTAIYLIFRLKLKNKPFKEICLYLAELLILGISVCILSSFSLFPQLKLVFSGSRIVIKEHRSFLDLINPNFKGLFLFISRLYGNDVLGNGVTTLYKGDYLELAQFCSCLFIPLLIFYILVSTKNRKFVLGISITCFLAILFPFISFFFNAFQTVNYRWTIIIQLIMCLLIALSLDYIIRNRNSLNKKYIKISILSGFGIFCISTLSSCLMLNQNIGLVINNNLMPYLVILIVYIFFFILFSINFKNKTATKCIKAFSFLMFLTELTLNYYSFISPSNLSSNNAIYKDDSALVIQNIKNNDSSSFYRINKNFDSFIDKNNIPSCNDAMAQEYYGLKNYNSLTNYNYSYFLKSMGIYVCNPLELEYYIKNNIDPFSISGQTLNYIVGLYDRYDLMTYLGVKYFISNKPIEFKQSYTKLYDFNNLIVYKNNDCLPLSYFKKDFMSYKQFMKLDKDKKDKAIIKYQIIDKEIDDVQLNLDYDFTDFCKQKNECFNLLKFDNDYIEYSLIADTNGFVNISIPYDDNFEVYIDNNRIIASKMNCGLLGFEINQGVHNIKIKYVQKPFIIGGIVSLVSFVTLSIGFTIYLISNKKRKMKVIN